MRQTHWSCGSFQAGAASPFTHTIPSTITVIGAGTPASTHRFQGSLITLAHVTSSVTLDKGFRRTFLCRTSQYMFGLVHCLIDTHVVNLHVCREILAVTLWERAGTIWVSALEALAFATTRARRGEAPRVGHCNIHEQIHWFARYLRSCNRKTFAKDSIREFIVDKPFDVTTATVFFWRFPLDAIFMLGFVVCLLQGRVC